MLILQTINKMKENRIQLLYAFFIFCWISFFCCNSSRNSEKADFLSCFKPSIKDQIASSYNQEMILGNWSYQYSFSSKIDTCFDVEHTGFFPREISYKTCHDSIIEVSKPQIFEMRKMNFFANICTVHDSIPFRGDTYPIVMGEIIRDSYQGLEVVHYQGNKRGIGKGYNYNIINIRRDTLILSDRVSYEIPDVFHFFLKKD